MDYFYKDNIISEKQGGMQVLKSDFMFVYYPFGITGYFIMIVHVFTRTNGLSSYRGKLHSSTSITSNMLWVF